MKTWTGMAAQRCVARWYVVIALAMLSACGGGGGGGGSGGGGSNSGAVTPPVTPAPVVPAGSRPPPATVRSDNNPSGARLDRRADNYFPMAVGDNWTYERTNGAGGSTRTVTVRIVAGTAAGTVGWQETDPVDGEGTSGYRRTAEGLEVVGPFTGGLPDAAAKLVGDPLEYADPFYAVGSVRRVLRQGSYGQDVDGDGVNEGFSFELTQTFLGFEDYRIGARTVQAARFLTAYRITAMYSKPLAGGGYPADYVFKGSDETWWGPGIGLLRADRQYEDSTRGAVEPLHTLRLVQGTVAGQAVVVDDVFTRSVALRHNALLFDARRGVYYASVPGAVVGTGNRIATIDPASGAVAHSLPVGSEPGAMAIAADGASIYVGLDGSGEVVRLALPGFAEIGRVRLPSSQFYGQFVTETLAASPVDANVFAVALARPGVSPKHGGVALVRAMQVQPRQSQDHTGSNLIVFGADGQSVYGYNNETTEFGLRRLEVLADGLAERQVIGFGGGFYQRTIDRMGERLLVNNRVARTPGLELDGQFSSGSGCRFAAAGRILCLDANAGAKTRLLVADMASYALLDTLSLPASSGLDFGALVPGPDGMVAIRTGISHPAQAEATGILLVSSVRLR
ncbi:YncE family protein [Roseateles sp. LYH14W]|uniref:YncE family protein n=1 Tax=Pelomonas parva TaxID=3299032 RepID=A0ABW7F0Y7_9BURK